MRTPSWVGRIKLFLNEVEQPTNLNTLAGVKLPESQQAACYVQPKSELAPFTPCRCLVVVAGRPQVATAIRKYFTLYDILLDDGTECTRTLVYRPDKQNRAALARLCRLEKTYHEAMEWPDRIKLDLNKLTDKLVRL